MSVRVFFYIDIEGSVSRFRTGCLGVSFVFRVILMLCTEY